LLESLKDSKARDAVKSVLERFTGGGARQAAPPAPAAAEAAKPN